MVAQIPAFAGITYRVVQGNETIKRIIALPIEKNIAAYFSAALA